jgi:hypothetical protein
MTETGEERHRRDRLPRWLYERYSGEAGAWENLDRGDRIRWQEEADTVTRAVVKLSIYKIVERQ